MMYNEQHRILMKSVQEISAGPCAESQQSKMKGIDYPDSVTKHVIDDPLGIMSARAELLTVSAFQCGTMF